MNDFTPFTVVIEEGTPEERVDLIGIAISMIRGVKCVKFPEEEGTSMSVEEDLA